MQRPKRLHTWSNPPSPLHDHDEDDERREEHDRPRVPQDERERRLPGDQPGAHVPGIRRDGDQGRPVKRLLVPEQGPLHPGAQPVTDGVDVQGDEEQHEWEQRGDTPVGEEVHYPGMSTPWGIMVAGRVGPPVTVSLQRRICVLFHDSWHNCPWRSMNGTTSGMFAVAYV